jgi:hypothetical protein
VIIVALPVKFSVNLPEGKINTLCPTCGTPSIADGGGGVIGAYWCYSSPEGEGATCGGPRRCPDCNGAGQRHGMQPPV